jgi:hypothetical protein
MHALVQQMPDHTLVFGLDANAHLHGGPGHPHLPSYMNRLYLPPARGAGGCRASPGASLAPLGRNMRPFSDSRSQVPRSPGGRYPSCQTRPKGSSCRLSSPPPIPLPAEPFARPVATTRSGSYRRCPRRSPQAKC